MKMLRLKKLQGTAVFLLRRVWYCGMLCVYNVSIGYGRKAMEKIHKIRKG